MVLEVLSALVGVWPLRVDASHVLPEHLGEREGFGRRQDLDAEGLLMGPRNPISRRVFAELLGFELGHGTAMVAGLDLARMHRRWSLRAPPRHPGGFVLADSSP